jgi:dCTP deaminase
MGVLSDRQIKAGVKITPFVDGQKRDGVISSGLSSFGYDVRAGYKFQIFTDVNCSVIDPKAFDKRMLVDVDLTPPDGHDFSGGGPDPTCNRCGVYASNPYKDGVQWRGRCREYTPNHVLIPPNSFALAETVEHLEIPRDTLAIVLGKSTYARCGLVVNCTPLEPEWRGKVTMELSNTTPLPIKVYAGEGIAQVYFLRSDDRRVEPHYPKGCQTSYADRRGKYQDQGGLTHPFVDKGE